MSPRFSHRRSAFTLVELLVVIAIIALLVAILLPALREARRTAKQIQNITNQKQMATGMFSYAADFKDKIASFSWRTGLPGMSEATGFNASGGFVMTPVNPQQSDLMLCATQARDIIRRRSDPNVVQITTTLGNWIPHPTYSHLVLMDFLAARLPEPMLLSPEDKYRGNMTSEFRSSPNPLSYCMTLPSRYDGIREMWPFSSSYQFVPASYMPDREVGGGFLHQAGDQIYYQYAPGQNNRFRLGERKMQEVRFPAQKVFLMEDVGRHTGKREMPFVHPGATITVATFDGHVQELKTADTNPGAYWNEAGLRQPVLMTYEPQTAWGYPPWPSGGIPPTNLPGRCRWTFKGLKGIDFGGAEVR